MQDREEQRVIAEGGTAQLEELRGVLLAAGIPGEIVAPPKEKCSS